MISGGTTNCGFQVRGALVERMGRSPFLAEVAPISGAVEVLVAQVKAVSAETRLIVRGGELMRVMVEELALQFLKQLHRSFDEKRI